MLHQLRKQQGPELFPTCGDRSAEIKTGAYDEATQSWWRLPINGSFLGDGGRFSPDSNAGVASPFVDEDNKFNEEMKGNNQCKNNDIILLRENKIIIALYVRAYFFPILVVEMFRSLDISSSRYQLVYKYFHGKTTI